MTVETFFEKFELLAETSDAIERLRELALELAIQGRFSDRMSEDEPVEKLVYQLRKAKAATSRLKSTAEDSTASVELPFDLPDHWAKVRLCDIGVISGGHTPSKNNARFWNGDVNWFTSKDIKTDEIFESELKITEAAAKSPGLQLYPPGCLFMVARSGILKRTFPVAINRAPATANQDLKVLRPFVPGLERYLQIMFCGLTRFILSDLVKTGMTVQSLKYDEFAEQVFPLPPLAEQKRIVAKVDELMGLCDRLESEQKEREAKHAVLARAALARFAEAPTPANLEYLFHPSFHIDPADLRKSILTMAVQGKLVEQNAGDEPAADLVGKALTRLSTEKRKRAPEALPPVTDPPFEVPAIWAWARFQDIAFIASNLVDPKPYGDMLHLAPDNIEKGTGILLPCRTVREDEVKSGNHRFYAGQLVYSKIRPNLSKVVYVDFDGLCSADMYPIDPLIDPRYLMHYILSEAFLHQAVKTDTRVAMPKINQNELNAIAVAVPPLAEQRRIVAKVDALMALVDRLEAQLAESRSLAGRLMEAVVAELTRQG